MAECWGPPGCLPFSFAEPQAVRLKGDRSFSVAPSPSAHLHCPPLILGIRRQLIILALVSILGKDPLPLRTASSSLAPRLAEPAAVVVSPPEAREFLTSARRPRRNIWDGSRPDMWQWIMHFMYTGYDEAVRLFTM
ncbi:hypothetical protein GN956_G4442 [Arapaima gigas]